PFLVAPVQLPLLTYLTNDQIPHRIVDQAQ
ncbi:hypothetical protein D046_8523, partial [Vibrio parahaemolyticus V-223/04]